MIRTFDLAMETESLGQFLNDPHLKTLQFKVRCSETGYTTASLYYSRIEEPIERKRTRAIGRFILFNGVSMELDDILSDPSTKLINKYEFLTEQGVIIVIDYEIKNERS